MASTAVQKAIERLDKLITAYDAVPVKSVVYFDVATQQDKRGHSKGHDATLEVRVIQALTEIAPNSAYSDKPPKNNLYMLVARAKALKADLEDGYGSTLQELAHAEVFDDHLDQAQELFDHKYYVAAAVIAGSAGEAHLKRLAIKNNVDVLKPDGSPLKATTINDNLVKASIYSLSQGKLITGWQGIRNDAAHGDVAKVTPALVEGLIQGLRNFMVNYPA